jgi:hypothetical protein
MANTKGSDNPFPSILVVEGTEPTAPSAGQQRLYIDSTTHKLKRTDSTGTDVTIEAAAGLSDPMTTRGDIIIRNASNVTARLAKGSASQVLTSDGTDVAWATPAGGASALAAASYKRTAGDYTTTSTSFVDVDGTNLALTITTGARRVLVSLAAQARHDSVSGSTFIDLMLDGTSLSGATNGIVAFTQNNVNYLWNPSFTYITDALSAGSHTFKLRWRVDAGTGTLRGNTTTGVLRFAVAELLAA